MDRWISLILGMGMALFLAPLGVTGAEEKSAPREREARTPTGVLERLGQMVPPEVLEKLNLSSEQKEKVARLQKEFQEKNKDALAGIREKAMSAREEMQKATQNRDPDAMRKAGARMAEVSQAMQKLHGDFEIRFLEILNQDQRKQYEDWKSRPRGSGLFPGGRSSESREEGPLPSQEVLEHLNLGEEQKEKLMRIQKEFQERNRDVLESTRAKAEKIREEMEKAGRDPEARRKAEAQMAEVSEQMQKLHGELHARFLEVLNADQKKRYEDWKSRSRRAEVAPGERPRDIQGGLPLPPQFLERLNLNEEQREKIARLRREFEGRFMEVLTDEQKKQLEEMKREGRSREERRPLIRPRENRDAKPLEKREPSRDRENP